MSRTTCPSRAKLEMKVSEKVFKGTQVSLSSPDPESLKLFDFSHPGIILGLSDGWQLLSKGGPAWVGIFKRVHFVCNNGYRNALLGWVYLLHSVFFFFFESHTLRSYERTGRSPCPPVLLLKSCLDVFVKPHLLTQHPFKTAFEISLALKLKLSCSSENL